MYAVPPRELAPGAAPPIVLIHGVGFGPATLATLARALEAHAPVIVQARRGYGERGHLAPGATVAQHVEDVIDALDGHGAARGVLVGVSGGATVALAAALSFSERVAVAVAHEPAAGSCSPELRALVRQTLEEGGGRGLVRVLAGARTWETLSPETVSKLDRAGALIEADARAFLEFEPAMPPPGVRVPLVCSVGERSGPLRLTIARRLAARTGAPVAVIPGCGHLAQLDAPDAFARLILEYALAARLASDPEADPGSGVGKEHPA